MTSILDPTISSKNLTLWGGTDQQIYIMRIDALNWIYIINNAAVFNLTQIQFTDDKIILYSNTTNIYYSLDSEYLYTSNTLTNIYSSSSFIAGSWLLLYYQANSKKN